MAKVIVIADDLTGSNATGVLLKKNGLDTCTVLNAKDATSPEVQRSGCLVIPTNSRAIPAQDAYRSVADTLSPLISNEIGLYAKRIDSTLRGNLGSETDAFLDLLGEDTIAVCVPCFPTSGRVLVGGYMLVNGVPLQKTSVAQDPKCPITTSSAKALFKAQSKYPVASIHLDDIARGAESLGQLFAKLKGEGNRIIICDSMVNEDMETIADALILAGISFVPVDPGVFTAICAKRKVPSDAPKSSAKKVLCMIGSVNAVAREQVNELLSNVPQFSVLLEVKEILESAERRTAEISRIVNEVLAHKDEHSVFSVIGCGIDPMRRVPFEPYMQRDGVDMETLSERITNAFAEIAVQLFEKEPAICGLYSTGGDITAAINSLFGTLGLKLYDEVVPLAGYGELIGGKFPGLKFISKGGMVGDPKAMVTCVNYLKERL